MYNETQQQWPRPYTVLGFRGARLQVSRPLFLGKNLQIKGHFYIVIANQNQQVTSHKDYSSTGVEQSPGRWASSPSPPEYSHVVRLSPGFVTMELL